MSGIGAIRTRRTGAVEEITITRPDRLNALDLPSSRELREALRSAGLERGIRAVVLTGEGAAFCPRGDVAASFRS